MKHAAAHILDALQGASLAKEFLSEQMSQNLINPLFDIRVTNIYGQSVGTAGAESISSGARLPLTEKILLGLQQGELLSVVSADRVELEITETLLHNDERQALEALQALRQMGFSVWLDDFGTGHSSLNHLKTFLGEGIKIDRSYISNLAGSESDRRMVSALLGLAHAFSVQVIAEGIDNQSSLEFLRAHGCRIGQGMMLGEPMSKLDLIDFLKNIGESSQTL